MPITKRDIGEIKEIWMRHFFTEVKQSWPRRIHACLLPDLKNELIAINASTALCTWIVKMLTHSVRWVFAPCPSFITADSLVLVSFITVCHLCTTFPSSTWLEVTHYTSEVVMIHVWSCAVMGRAALKPQTTGDISHGKYSKLLLLGFFFFTGLLELPLLPRCTVNSLNSSLGTAIIIYRSRKSSLTQSFISE